MKKITTLALTGALALGGLGVGSMADLPIPNMQAEQASAAMTGISADIYTMNSSGTIQGRFEADTATNHVGRSGTLTIKKGSLLVKTLDGTITRSAPVGGPDVPFWYHTTANHNISASQFSDGVYTVTFSYTAGGKTLTSSSYFEVKTINGVKMFHDDSVG